MRQQTIIALGLVFFALQSSAEPVASGLPVVQSGLRASQEDVQWLPYAVTVLKKSDLEETYRRDLETLESMAPGLLIDRMNTTPRGAAIAIRGIGSAGSSKAFDPAVAVNIDGVYVGTHTSRLRVLFDFEEIEIVRGPNTFEANPNTAGSINLTRTAPTGEFDVEARASAGADNLREADLVLNAPEIGGISGKLAAYWKDKGGEYMVNVFNDRDENTEDYHLLTATLAWNPSDTFSASYTYDNENSDETTPALLNISAPSDLLCVTTASLPFPNCRRGVGNPELDSVRLTAQNYSNQRQFEGDYHTLRLDFDALGHSFTSITGYRKTDEDMKLDLDASNADFYHVNRTQGYEQLSQEITARGRWGENLTYQGGVYYLDTEYDIFQEEFHILQELGDAGFSEGHAAGEIQELTSRQQSRLLSGFIHANYLLGAQWTADIGARFTEVDRDFLHSPSRIRLGNSVSPLRTLLKGQETSKKMRWSGGLTYKVDEEAMIYFRYSEGFLPGGFDENAMSALTGNAYGSESSATAEIGLKSDWWDDKLRVNVTYFYTELDNKLERFDAYVPDSGIESLLDNVAQVEISGWEFEIESVPLENLYLRTSYSLLDANYSRYYVQDLANQGMGRDLSGLSPARAPDENLFLSAEYALPLGPGILRGYAGYRLFSDYQTYPLLPEGAVNNWMTWDLSVSYEWRDLVFRLFSNNINDKEYIQNINNITQTAIVPVDAARQAVPSLLVNTEYNQPRYTGIEIIYRPAF